MEKSKYSLLNKKWTPAPEIEDEEGLYSHLLSLQGLNDPEEISQYLNPRPSHLHAPEQMLGMKEAVDRIQRAITQQERIMIYGDFDADGITSTVILVSALKELGAKVSYRIPDRGKDSHGLKNYHIDEIAEQNVRLIITCDCGINDHKEVEYAAKKGMDVIITDHHEPDPKRFPKKAVAILNPLRSKCAYPEKNLSGSGVALKLIQGVANSHFASEAQTNEFVDKYYEVCVIGLVADCVKLSGENRVLAKIGLEKLKNPQWEGLKELLVQSDIDLEGISEETIGFHIAPRLNASSRIGNVLMATQLFLGEEKGHFDRVQKLEKWNVYRQDLTEAAMAQAHPQINEGADFQYFTHPDWLPGILGLVAGRYCNQLGVPIIAGRKQDGLIKASCRAPKGYSIIAALKSCEDCFLQYGGHDGAAGFSIKEEDLSRLIDQLNDYFRTTEAEVQNTTAVSAVIGDHLLTLDLAEFLKQMGPYGIGNPLPIFRLNDLTVIQHENIGKNKNHLRLTTQDKNGTIIEFMAFFLGELSSDLEAQEKIDALCTIGINYWRGEAQLQLRLEDIAKGC